MACEFPVAVKAKLMLTAIHCLLYFTLLWNMEKLVKLLENICRKSLSAVKVDNELTEWFIIIIRFVKRQNVKRLPWR